MPDDFRQALEKFPRNLVLRLRGITNGLIANGGYWCTSTLAH
jgi:hypothetical protein